MFTAESGFKEFLKSVNIWQSWPPHVWCEI